MILFDIVDIENIDFKLTKRVTNRKKIIAVPNMDEVVISYAIAEDSLPRHFSSAVNSHPFFFFLLYLISMKGVDVHRRSSD
jgi:hypothetical protein